MGEPEELVEGVGEINLAGGGFWKTWGEVEEKAPTEMKNPRLVRAVRMEECCQPTLGHFDTSTRGHKVDSDNIMEALHVGKDHELTDYVANYKGDSLDFGNKNLGDTGAIALAKGLQENKECKLEKLDISSNSIGAEGARHIAKALEENKECKLQTLDISENDICPEGAAAIANMLKVNTSLATLVLYSNKIGAAGATAIAKALQVNKTLTSLDLYYNEIGDAGALAIGEALRANNSIRSINLRNNNIGHEGAKAIGLALQGNKILREINLGWNEIGVAGAQAIGEALKMNTSLQELDMRRNNIRAEGARAFGEALKINLSLRELGMDEHVKGKDEYFEMNKLYATVIQQSNFQALGLQIITEFFLAAKADSPEQVIAFVSMMPEIKTSEENKATPDIMLQNAARVGLLEACKVLTSSKDFDFDKSAARKAGEGSSDAATKEFFRVYGLDLYLGRYLRAQEPAYESPTCSVWMAEDVKAENAQDAKVALKVIKAGVPGAQHSFEREVRSRDTLGSLPGFVLPLIRTHKEELCLVMPAGDYSLAEFLRRRDIPGRDVKKLVHGDV
eukprot:g3157.t1